MSTETLNPRQNIQVERNDLYWICFWEQVLVDLPVAAFISVTEGLRAQLHLRRQTAQSIQTDYMSLRDRSLFMAGVEAEEKMF